MRALNFLRVATLGGLLSMCASAFAVTDPDPIGRSIKFLDRSTSVSSYFTTNTQCPTPQPPINVPVRCFLLSGVDNETGALADVLTIDVAAATVRSVLNIDIGGSLMLNFLNKTTAAKNGTVSLTATITVDSAILNDPSLINPITQAPFNGKIDLKYTFFVESENLEPNKGKTMLRRISLAPVTGLLSKKVLVDNYGLSSTLARQVMTQPMRVRVAYDIRSTAVSSATIGSAARLTSD